MKKLLMLGLLVMLVVVAGCAQKAADEAQAEPQATVPTTTVGPETTGDSVGLDASASDVDSLDADLSSDDVDQQLAGINPDEVKDINF